MNLRKWLPPLIVLGIISLIFGIFYARILYSPNQYFLNSEGDATKNYYTPWYHVLHDSTAHWFSGMNYPYGDHVVFADAQPALTNTLRAIHHQILPIGQFTPGIMNLLMLLSVFWAGWLLYLIFRRWSLPPLYSAVWAGLLASMSPQIFRLNGHYALAYACVVPLIWYCLIRFRQKPNWRWSAVLATVGIVLSGLHPYYLMVYALLLGSIFLMDRLVPGDKIPWRTAIMHLIVQVVVPLAFFKLYLALTDPASDRPETPYGFLAYRSSWKSVFFQYLFPWVQNARKAMHLGPVHPEGYAYVGLPGLFTAIALIGLGLRNLVRRNWSVLANPLGDREKNITLFAAILIFLFASGYLFPGKLGEWVSHIPLLSQFRSTGRFAWIFFYFWGGITAWLLYGWMKHRAERGLSRWAKIFVGVLCGMMAVEAVYFNYLVRRDHAKAQPLAQVREKAQPLQKAIAPYQQQTNALLFLPYFHIGSENFSSLRRSSFSDEMMVSLQTGLPMLNASLSRSSFEQAWKLVQFPLAQPSTPELLADLPSHFQLLAIANQEAIRRKLTIPWLDQTQLLSTDSAYTLWKITPATANAAPLHFGRWVQLGLQDSLARQTVSTLPGDSLQGDPSAYWSGFDKRPEKRVPLLTLHLPPKDSALYYFSIWAKMRRDQVPVARLWATQKPTDGRPPYQSELFAQVWTKAMAGEWAMIEVPLVPPYGDTPLVLEWQPYGDRHYLELRSWLLRTPNTHICFTDSATGVVYRNNYRLPLGW